jgi:hypothetical protein
MQHTNAILAINSLDRYITNQAELQILFNAIWASGATTLTWVSGEIPIVGAVTDSFTVVGIQAGTTITNWDPTTNTITIDRPTTFVATTPTQLIWTYRYTTSIYNNSLLSSYIRAIPFSNSFTLQSQTNYIYGYIRKIIVSQIQIQYNVPTVNEELNDKLFFVDDEFANTFNATWASGATTLTWVSGTTPIMGAICNGFTGVGIQNGTLIRNWNSATNTVTIDRPTTLAAAVSTLLSWRSDKLYQITIPHGFYWPDELAAALQQLIRTSTLFVDMTVTFDVKIGFLFQAGPTYTKNFHFPGPLDLREIYNVSQSLVENALKVYRMLGITFGSGDLFPDTEQESGTYPNFLYTPYIDIYSDTLTNYQTIKDTNTSIANQKGLIARVYLSGTGNIQNIEDESALGSRAFTMTSDLNSPKIIEWTPDVTVTQIDIQLKDQYGELLPGPENGYQTEFQITLLCSE